MRVSSFSFRAAAFRRADGPGRWELKPETRNLRNSDPRTEPFFWRAGDRGCLLVHGLTGTPYEMHYLGEQLYAAGYTVNGICLAGHATHVEDLATCRWTDWYASVQRGLEDVRASCSAVVAVGLSLGSLLVLRLAHLEAKAIAAVVLLSSPLVLGNPWPARLAGTLGRILPLLPQRLRFVPKRSEIADPEALRIHPGYQRLPLRSVVELIALQRQVRALLPLISQPVLAIQGLHDPTAPIANLAILRDGLAKAPKTVILPASRHVVTVDLEKSRVSEEIVHFLASVIGHPQPQADARGPAGAR